MCRFSVFMGRGSRGGEREQSTLGESIVRERVTGVQQTLRRLN